MASEVVNEQIMEWRAKAALGELSIPEMRLAIEAIRKERALLEAPKPKKRAAAGAAAKPKKIKPEDIDTDDLLKELF